MRAHPNPTRLNRTRRLSAALALATAAAAAGSAAGQVYVDQTPAYADPAPASVDEVVITGRLGPDGRPDRISRVIGLADLDLTTREDRAVLRLRIRDTARDLCHALGEDSGGSSPLVASCEDQAVRDTRPQVRIAIARAYASLDYASQATANPYAWRPDPY